MRERFRDWNTLNTHPILSLAFLTIFLYPVWPHRQCFGLAFRRLHVSGSLSAASLVICSRHCTVQYVELWGYCPVYGGGSRFSVGRLLAREEYLFVIWRGKVNVLLIIMPRSLTCSYSLMFESSYDLYVFFRFHFLFFSITQRFKLQRFKVRTVYTCWPYWNVICGKMHTTEFTCWLYLNGIYGNTSREWLDQLIQRAAIIRNEPELYKVFNKICWIFQFLI